MRTYSELITIDSFEDRLEYLKLLDNNVTSPRHMSWEFYQSNIWKMTRSQVISRDLNFDLGIFGIYIPSKVYVHHIEPIYEYDIIHMTDKLLNPENLITCSLDTHNKIHYVTKERDIWVPREAGDTKFW